MSGGIVQEDKAVKINYQNNNNSHNNKNNYNNKQCLIKDHKPFLFVPFFFKIPRKSKKKQNPAYLIQNCEGDFSDWDVLPLRSYICTIFTVTVRHILSH